MKRIKNIFMVVGLVVSTSLWAEYPMPYPVDTIDGKAYYRYTVEKSIGLYRISKNFDVTQEEILEANPELHHRGLKFKEVILVPAKAVVNDGEEVKNDNINNNQQLAEHPSIVVVKSGEDRLIAGNEEKEEKEEKEEERAEKTTKIGRRHRVVFDDAIEEGENSQLTPMNEGEERLIAMKSGEEDTIRLAVMLPLMANAVKRDRNMDRFYDFYTGVLLAINEVQKDGQHIELFTYDIGKGQETITTLLNDSTWPEVDAIIGPVYNAQVAVAAEFAKRDSTPVVIPFASKVVGLENNPFVYKFNPSDQLAADTLARYLKQYGDSVNCVLFESDADDIIPQSVSAIHQALQEHAIPTTTIALRALLTDSLDGYFAPGKENIVIFNTEKYGNLQGVMSHLLSAAEKYPTTLFSRYSWQQEKINLPQIYTAVFAEGVEVSEGYEATYAEYFGHELSSTQPRYDLLGYDIVSQLLAQLMQREQDNEEDEEWHGMQSDIQYKAVVEGGGKENQMIHIVRK